MMGRQVSYGRTRIGLIERKKKGIIKKQSQLELQNKVIPPNYYLENLISCHISLLSLQFMSLYICHFLHHQLIMLSSFSVVSFSFVNNKKYNLVKFNIKRWHTL